MVYMDKTVRGHVHRTAGILPVTERMEHVLKDVWMVYTDKTALYHVHRTAGIPPVTEKVVPVPLVVMTVSMVMTVRIVSIKYTIFRCFHCSRNEKFIKLYIRTAIAQSGLNALNKLFTMLNSTEN